MRLAGDRSSFAPATCQANIVARSMSVLTADMAALHVFFVHAGTGMYGIVCEAPKLGFSEACNFAVSSVCVRNVSCMLSCAGS